MSGVQARSRFADPAQVAKRERAAGDRLPYARHVDDTTLETRDGLLMKVLHLRGFAFETAETEELNYRKAIRETMLRGVSNSSFAVYHHVVRRRVRPELEGAYDDVFCRWLDKSWRAQLDQRRLLANELFLTIVRRPAQGRAGVFDLGRLRAGAKGADPQSRVVRSRQLRELESAAESFLASLAPYEPRLLGVYESERGLGSEAAEFLSCLYNQAFSPVLLPHGDLGRHLPARRISFGLDALELSPGADAERSFAALVSMKEYPPHTAPGLLDDVLRLPHELVLTESFGFIDRQAALEKMNLAIRRMRSADEDSITLRSDLVAAKDDLSSGRSAFGEHHLTVMVRAPGLDALNEAVAETQAAFTDVGVIAVREDVNLEPAFWAQFPGNFKDIARRSLISTSNFAGLASCHNHPLGQAEGNHWGPAVTVLETTSGSPYYFNFHKGDLGNFTLIGPSGAGKTVILAFLLAQSEKFNPRIVYFDKDRGAEIFLRAIGGRYDVLRPGSPSGMNPLQLPETLANRAFLNGWLTRLLTPQGEMLNANEQALVADAVNANFAQTPEHRRLRYLRELFQGVMQPTAHDLAARLAIWCDQGERAWLFDNEDDQLDLDERVIGLDMTQLLDDPATRTPAMMYLFHRVEERLDGSPAIIVIDEGWKALDDEVFVQRLKDWEKTIRKRNGIVGFCTQSAHDALGSRISSAIVEQAATQIFLPNPKAQAEEYCKGFGLTMHEFNLVRTLPDTSRCFLVKHGFDSVVARLNLSGLPHALTVLSGRESTVRRLDGLRSGLGDDPRAWLPALLTA